MNFTGFHSNTSHSTICFILNHPDSSILSIFVSATSHLCLLCQTCHRHSSLLLSFPQYGVVGPVSHSGGPGAWCPACHPQRGLWPARGWCHPQTGGENTWVTVCSLSFYLVVKPNRHIYSTLHALVMHMTRDDSRLHTICVINLIIVSYNNWYHQLM